MIKEQLENEKKSFVEVELEQLKLHRMIWEKERKTFESIDAISYISKCKNNDDIQILMEKITEWVTLTKDNPEKNAVYVDLLKCIYRIYSYCFNIETTVGQAGVMMHTSETILKNTVSAHNKEKMQYVLKINKLEKELEIAKKEIEFITKNSKS
jgi:hypothetical protein